MSISNLFETEIAKYFNPAERAEIISFRDYFVIENGKKEVKVQLELPEITVDTLNEIGDSIRGDFFECCLLQLSYSDPSELDRIRTFKSEINNKTVEILKSRARKLWAAVLNDDIENATDFGPLSANDLKFVNEFASPKMKEILLTNE